ncbi:unnamed protein product [Prunus armeniaca]
MSLRGPKSGLIHTSGGADRKWRDDKRTYLIFASVAIHVRWRHRGLKLTQEGGFNSVKGNNGCVHFEWYDLEMCPCSKAIIPRFLRNRIRLEEEVAVLRAKQKKLWAVLVVSWFLVFAWVLW